MSEIVEFDISGYTSVNKSAKLIAELSEILPKCGTVKLVAPSAKRLCTSSAQILISFINAAKERGGDVSWGDISDACKDSIISAGWEDKLLIS